MTRLYYPDNLITGQSFDLPQGQTHYLRHVLRLRVSDQLHVFNERQGEWSASITALSKTTATVTVEKQISLAVIGPCLTLLFALIKHDPLTFLVEKATELGVRHFHPVITERCNVARINPNRLTNNMVHASQQCQRFDIPELHPLVSLKKALETWESAIPLLVCQEWEKGAPIARVLQDIPPKAPVGFLIGPEGGFSPQDITILNSFSFVRLVSLGPRILRAETAALAALTCYQALIGDWGGES